MDLKMTGGNSFNSNKPTVKNAIRERMNFLIARQGIVASNVANASTPGYISRDLSFSGQLKKAGVSLNTTNKMHIQGGNNSLNKVGKVTYDETNMRDDGNSVKLDQEMLKLNEIQLNYRLMTKLFTKYSAMQNLALQGNR